MKSPLATVLHRTRSVRVIRDYPPPALGFRFQAVETVQPQTRRMTSRFSSRLAGLVAGVLLRGRLAA
jgi:hypothetical protein